MSLDREKLARIDRRLFAEFDDTTKTRPVRIRVSDPLWSTWRRYCDLVEVSMGDAIAALVADELESLVGEDDGRTLDLIEATKVALKQRSTALDDRERQLDVREERLRRREQALFDKEMLAADLRKPRAAVSLTVGRNEACPCGSGIKYKRCHGQPT